MSSVFAMVALQFRRFAALPEMAQHVEAMFISFVTPGTHVDTCKIRIRRHHGEIHIFPSKKGYNDAFLLMIQTEKYRSFT